MSLTKPYFRIARGISYDDEDDLFTPYVLDARYCQERSSLCRAYKILQKDLETLFEYIEPCDSNNETYSHRTFELMLRICTEFEANCKGILAANNYNNNSNNLNIKDYWKINTATKLSDYKLILKTWHPNPLELRPFSQWQHADYQPLSWYQAYNDAKHNRDTKFHRSNLECTIQALAGLLCILYAQFNIHTTHLYRPPQMLYSEDSLGMEGLEGSIFDISPPTWSDLESYDFEWKVLKHTPDPFEKCQF
jgi:hypothetical protein